jgi:AcrR family transcriptional regulator
LGGAVDTSATNRQSQSSSGEHAGERKRILSAAARIFHEFGVAASSLERIVSEAGLSRGTVLRHFDSKRDLITVYVQQWAADRRAEAERLGADHHGDPRGLLTACAEMLNLPNGTVPGRSWVHYAAEMPADDEVRRLVIDLRHWYVDFLARAFTQLGHPEPRGAAAVLLMFHTGAMTTGVLEGVDPEAAHTARQLCAALIDGVA